MQVCYYVENVTCVNSTLNMVGMMDNSYKLHWTYEEEEVGFLTYWEAVEPQIWFEVLHRRPWEGRYTGVVTTRGWY